MRLTLFSEVAQVANGSALGNVVDCPEAWLTLCGPAPTVTGVIPQPGRYYVIAYLLKSRSNVAADIESILWTGYLGGDMPSSFPNLKVHKEQAVSVLVFSGTNGTIANDGRLRFYYGFDTERPRGGAWLHSQQPFTGPGEPRSIALGDPAAGSDYANVVVPSQVRWGTSGFAGTFVTGVTGTVHVFHIVVTDGTNRVGAIGGADVSQGASLTINYVGGRGSMPSRQSLVTGEELLFGMSDIIITPGHVEQFITDEIGGDDNWGAGFLRIEEWAGPAA